MSDACLDLATLFAYWQGELDGAREEVVELHYLGCERCSRQLGDVEAIAAGVRQAFASGGVAAILSVAFVERLRSQGLRLREYRVPLNGSVNCSIAPQDQMVVGHLEVPLEGVERIDAIVQGDREERLEDVPFDAARGAVVLLPSIAHMRTLPASRQVVRLVAIEGDGERVLGEYTFNHSPHR